MRWCTLIRMFYTHINPPKLLASHWNLTIWYFRSSGEWTITSPIASSSAPTFILDSNPSMRSQSDILFLSRSVIFSTSTSIWIYPWSVNPLRVGASIFFTLSVTVRMFWRTPSWNTDNSSKINVNSSLWLFCVKIASPNLTLSYFIFSSAHPTCSIAALIFLATQESFPTPAPPSPPHEYFSCRVPRFPKSCPWTYQHTYFKDIHSSILYQANLLQ